MEKKTVSRKKFLFWGASVSAVLAVPTIFLFRKKKPETQQPKIVKMLGQDGKLVEVDLTKIAGSKGQINDIDIHTWVKTKPSQF